jgi:hypothetical protein
MLDALFEGGRAPMPAPPDNPTGQRRLGSNSQGCLCLPSPLPLPVEQASKISTALCTQQKGTPISRSGSHPVRLGSSKCLPVCGRKQTSSNLAAASAQASRRAAARPDAARVLRGRQLATAIDGTCGWASNPRGHLLPWAERRFRLPAVEKPSRPNDQYPEPEADQYRKRRPISFRV